MVTRASTARTGYWLVIVSSAGLLVLTLTESEFPLGLVGVCFSVLAIGASFYGLRKTLRQPTG